MPPRKNLIVLLLPSHPTRIPFLSAIPATFWVPVPLRSRKPPSQAGEEPLPAPTSRFRPAPPPSPSSARARPPFPLFSPSALLAPFLPSAFRLYTAPSPISLGPPTQGRPCVFAPTSARPSRLPSPCPPPLPRPAVPRPSARHSSPGAACPARPQLSSFPLSRPFSPRHDSGVASRGLPCPPPAA